MKSENWHTQFILRSESSIASKTQSLHFSWCDSYVKKKKMVSLEMTSSPTY